MSNSDIIGLCDILVTIFVGFFLAHKFSVKDTRTRSVKDYYISELTSIRKNVEEKFQDLLDGKVSAKALVKWTDDIEAHLHEFDIGLRIVLPVYARPLQNEIGDLLDILTNIDNINEQYDNEYIDLSTEACISVREISKNIHERFAQYLYMVNMASSYGFIDEIAKRYNSIRLYYQSTACDFPIGKSMLLICRQYLREYFWIAMFIVAVSILAVNQFRKTETTSSVEKSVKYHNEIFDSNDGKMRGNNLLIPIDTFPRHQYYVRPR